MHIPAHQIQNVLKAYKKLLVVKKDNEEPSVDAAEPAFVEKRRLILEKITRDIANRILNSGNSGKQPVKPDPIAGDVRIDSQFKYNTITFEGGKETRFLAMESSDFLFKSVEQVAGNGSGGEGSDPEIEGA